MATPRDIRRLAFQTLFQLDARTAAGSSGDAEDVRAGLAAAEGYSDGERRKAFELAQRAFEERGKADAATVALAPTWPAHRQAAVDRAILRLAHYEMAVKGVDPRIAISEAVELAKEFSTDKSPAFINGLLDKIAKTVRPPTSAAPEGAP